MGKFSPAGGQQFGYDGFGNLITQTPVYGSAPTMSLTVDPGTNHVTGGTVQYDAAGNLTNDGTNTYGFDEMNRLTSTGNLTYAYSPMENKRLLIYNNANASAPVATLNLYGPDGKRLAVASYQLNGTTWSPMSAGQTNYFYLGSKPLNYTDDAVGSNATAGTYWPYGQVKSGVVPWESQAFGTYVADESNLLYAGQRYYYQNWGRFLTADPSDRNIDYTRSGSWNRYFYGNGDPVNGNDPTGQYLDVGDYACLYTGGNWDLAYGMDDPPTFTVGEPFSSGSWDVPISGPFAAIFSGPDSVGAMLNSTSVGVFGYGEAAAQISTGAGSIGVQVNVIGSYDSSSGFDPSASFTVGPGSSITSSPGESNTGAVSGWSLEPATSGPSLPSGGVEVSPSGGVQGATFIPIFGAAGVFINSCGLIGVYAGGPEPPTSASGPSASLSAGGGIYFNFGCH